MKPGKLKRIKLKARAAKESSGVGVFVDPPCPALSQPGLGSPEPGMGSEQRTEVGGMQRM